MAGRILTFRLDDVTWLPGEVQAREVFQVAVPSDRWRFGERDMAVFFDGRGDEIRFASWARVLGVTRENEPNRVRDRDWWDYDVTVESRTPLPEDRTLANFAYSLPKIARLRQPWRHIGHRWSFSDIDFEILLSGQIHERRTFYFGLLAALGSDWSVPLDRRANAEHLQNQGLAPKTPSSSDDGARVDELRGLLERLVITPAVFANDIATAHRALFEGAPDPQLDLGSSERAFPITPRGDAPAEIAATLTATFVEAKHAPPELFIGAQWRAHHL